MSTKDEYTPFPLDALTAEATWAQHTPARCDAGRLHVVVQSESCRYASCMDAAAMRGQQLVGGIAAFLSSGSIPGADRYDPEVLDEHGHVLLTAYIGFQCHREEERLEALIDAHLATFECGCGQGIPEDYDDSEPTEAEKLLEQYEDDYGWHYVMLWDREWLKHLDELEAEASQ